MQVPFTTTTLWRDGVDLSQSEWAIFLLSFADLVSDQQSLVQIIVSVIHHPIWRRCYVFFLPTCWLHLSTRKLSGWMWRTTSIGETIHQDLHNDQVCFAWNCSWVKYIMHCFIAYYRYSYSSIDMMFDPKPIKKDSYLFLRYNSLQRSQMQRSGFASKKQAPSRVNYFRQPELLQFAQQATILGIKCTVYYNFQIMFTSELYLSYNGSSSSGMWIDVKYLNDWLTCTPSCGQIAFKVHSTHHSRTKYLVIICNNLSRELQSRRGLTLGASASRTDSNEFEPLPAYMFNCKLLMIFPYEGFICSLSWFSPQGFYLLLYNPKRYSQ